MKNKLSAKQLKAIDDLVSNPNIMEVVRSTGIKERTLRRWLTVPLFQQTLKEARVERIQANRKLLQSLDEIAIQTLREIILDPKTSAREKRLAAVDILKLSSQSYADDEIEFKVSRLERIIENDNKYKQKDS